MVIHTSTYEEHDGWIPISKEIPPEKKRVSLCHINFLDWNLETMEWEGSGWILPSGIWSLRIPNRKEVPSYKQTPTHWKEFKY